MHFTRLLKYGRYIFNLYNVDYVNIENISIKLENEIVECPMIISVRAKFQIFKLKKSVFVTEISHIRVSCITFPAITRQTIKN